MFVKYEIISNTHFMGLSTLNIVGSGNTKEKAFKDLLNSIEYYIEELEQIKTVNIGNIQPYKHPFGSTELPDDVKLTIKSCKQIIKGGE